MNYALMGDACMDFFLPSGHQENIMKYLSLLTLE